MEYLEQRLSECFPTGNYALLAFLRLTDIVETDSVPTAAVECKVRPRLLINRQFVDDHAETPEKLLMLVMHELHHVLLGHTKLFPTATPVQNFVFDCVINALLSRMFPSPDHTDFFTHFYSDAKFPECFLRPPDQWDGKHVVNIPKGISKLDRRRKRRKRILAELYRALYSESGVSYYEIYQLLPKHIKSCTIGIPLLGGHCKQSKGTGPATEDGDDDSTIDSTNPDLPSNSPELFDIVRSIVEKWPQPPDPIKGRSFSDIVREADVNPATDCAHGAKLRNVLKWLGKQSVRGDVREVTDANSDRYSAVPGFARRDLILQSLEQNPLLFTQPIVTRQRVPVSERVHVYVDVSGSMSDVIGVVYGAVSACSEWVYQRVHLFSNEVVDVSLGDFRKGKVKSSYGTDISCVAQHIKANGINRACLVTDGYVGTPQGEELQTLANTRLGVVFAGDSITQDLEAVTDIRIEIKI